jgi:hypothetical protein
MRQFFLISFGLALLVLPLGAQEKRSLNYRRDKVSSSPAVRVSKPTRQDLPQELVITSQPTEARRSGHGDEPGSRVVNRRGQGRNDDSRVRDLAEDAARWSANELAASFGYREYYRIGFHRGLKAALNEATYNNWDYNQGRRQAARDYQIERDGQATGTEAAARMAQELAESRGRVMFMDLSPRPLRQPAVGRFQVPEFAGELYEPPSLEGLFREMSLHSFDPYRRQRYRFYEGWQPDPWNLYQANSYESFYDKRWRKAKYALNYFCRDRKRAAAYNQLSNRDQETFRKYFNQSYGDFLAANFHKFQDRAYDTGWRDSYEYGIHVGVEYQYQRGYFEGATQNFTRTAEDAFARQYPQDYRRFYNDTFDSWENNAVPGIEEIRLHDGNNDGVFEPGEAISATYRLVNYGGRASTYKLQLNGTPLSSPLTTRERLPARDRIQVEASGRARLATSLRTKTDYELVLTVGEAQAGTQVYVSYPLEMADVRVAQRDNLSGRAQVAVTIRNTSRLPIRGALLTQGNQSYPLASFRAQDQQVQYIDLNGLDSLAMLAGQIDLDLKVATGQKLHDSLYWALPEQATDLGNHDILQVLLALARAPRRDDVAVRQSHQLLQQRMEADWQRAIASKGNPYKRDRRGANETAMGDLVRTWKQHRGTVRHPSVFTDLARMLESQGKRLPGTHPFLRKHFKRLARELR